MKYAVRAYSGNQMAPRSPYFVPPPPPPPPDEKSGGAPRGPAPSPVAGLKTLAIVLGTLVAVSLVALIALPALLDRKPQEPEQHDSIHKFKSAPKKNHVEKQPSALPILATDPRRGGRQARVTIVEFGDYQDPFTARAELTLKDLLDKYGKDLRVVWKDQPLAFHKDARRAASLARVVFFERSPERYWDFHDKMLRDQSKLSAELDVWADGFGADKTAIGLHGANADKLVDDSNRLAGDIGALGAPVFFIDGQKLSGARTKSEFEKIIDAHLTEAAELVDKGVDEGDLYAELVARHYDDEDPTPTGTLYQVDASSGPTWGAPDALVTVVLFADFEKPPAKPDGVLLGDLLALGDTRVVLRDAATSPAGRVAAKLVRAVGDKMGNVERGNAVDDLFTYGMPADWTKWGARFGLSAADVTAAIAAAPADKGIDDDRDRADEVDATNTAVYVNGRRQASLRKSDAVAAHAREKKRADRLVARGIAKSDVYAELTKKGKKTAPKHVTLTVPAWSPVRGPAGAKVTIHVFSEFQCPFCRRTATPGTSGFADAVAAHPEVRIVFRHNPLVFHKLAEPAAQMAMEAKAQKGNGAFWATHDALFAGSTPLTMARIESIALAQGLDLTKVRTAISGHLHKKQIDDDLAEAKRIGATGTPTFVVGDELVVGAQPMASFEAAIRRARAKAGP